MRFLLLGNAEAKVVDLAPGRLTVGGSRRDHVRVPGVVEGLLELEIDSERAVLRARERIRIDGLLFPRGVRRLWLPSETVELSDCRRLRRAPAPAAASESTSAVLRELVVDPLPRKQAPRLLCLTGLDAGRYYLLVRGMNLIGRGADATVRVRDRTVSRRHAALTWDDTLALEDLASPNGVFVGGQRLAGTTLLSGGDVIELGCSVLRLEDALTRRPQGPNETVLLPLKHQGHRAALAVAVAAEPTEG